MGKKRPVSIKLRVFLQVMGIFVLCFAVLLLINTRFLEDVYVWNAKRGIINLATEIENLENLELTYYIKLPQLERADNVSIELYNAYDEVLYEGADAGAFTDKTVNVISREDFPDGGYYTVLRESGSDAQYLLYGRTLKNGYRIEISALKQPITQSASVAVMFTYVLVTVGLGASFIFVSIFARRFAKPLIEMKEITGDMAQLKFGRKLDTRRRDEIGALADNINNLSDSLAGALGELKEKNKQLERDIEREKKLDEMRKEFVSSVSHELKTPIAVIRGYAEGIESLLSEDEQTALEYCGIVMSEADRMNGLVLRLLEVSLYESGSVSITEVPFSVTDMVQGYFSSCARLFSEKSVTVRVEADRDYTGFGDESRLYTVLNNYVSNAVSHAAGEKRVECSVKDTGKFIRVAVFNTGDPIDESNSEKLFMSFYRGNRAHSREEGRFGLGLSIVRAIAELHGTAYGCGNRDNGVEFWFDIKKAGEKNEN